MKKAWVPAFAGMSGFFLGKILSDLGFILIPGRVLVLEVQLQLSLRPGLGDAGDRLFGTR